MWFWIMVIVLAAGYFLWKSAQKRAAQEEVSRSRRDENSFTITISTSSPQAPAKKERGSDARWLLPGDTLEVAGYSISAGFLYAADYKPGVAGKWSDPSLINTRLPVADHPSSDAGDIGYWPAYSGLSPAHRAGYLQWLASGRKAPGVDTGYLFIFFYGLEKRAIDELIARGDWNEELDLITNEVERLRGLYQESGSFQGYTGSFLGLLACAKAVLTGSRVDLRSSLSSRWDVPLEVKLGLGEFAASGEPIPAQWALQWAYSSPAITLRTPARRCKEEFESLFLAIYAREYNKGMKVPPNKTPVRIEYQAASLAISSRPFRLSTQLPDITMLKRPTEKLRVLVEECTDMLDEYSRALGRKSAASLAQYLPALLPRELLSSITSGAVSRLREWLRERSSDGTIRETTAGGLISELEGVSPEELTRKKWELTSLLLGKLGFGIEPDAAYGGKAPNLSSSVYIFRQEWAPERKLSPEYRAYAASLPFAALVSATDGVDAAELEVISRRFADLGAAERSRLDARLRILLERPPTAQSLRSAVSGLHEQQKQRLAQYLLLIAAADGRITQEEIKALQKMYSILGLPPESVHSEIHELMAGGSGLSGKEPVAVRQATATSPSYKLPPEDIADGGVIVLDEESIRRKREESESVVTLLEDVFSEEEPPAELEAVDEDEEDQGEEIFDDAHRRLVLELLRSGEIPAERWAEMCREVSLLPDAAIESINGAVVERFEDVLIEKGDPLRVVTDIAELVGGMYE